MSNHNRNVTPGALDHIPVEGLAAVSGGRGRRAQFDASQRRFNELTSATNSTIKSIGDSTQSLARKQ